MTRRIAQRFGGAAVSPRRRTFAIGSNAKAGWIDDWQAVAAPDAQRDAALRSPNLASSIQHYLDGFAEDLDSFYAGINALAMLTIQINLAKSLTLPPPFDPD
jgi:hypothetical protein